jgi:hypothetical protein
MKCKSTISAAIHSISTFELLSVFQRYVNQLFPQPSIYGFYIHRIVTAALAYLFILRCTVTTMRDGKYYHRHESVR